MVLFGPENAILAHSCVVSFHGFIYSQIFILPFRSLYGVKVKRYPASLVLAAFLVVVASSSSFVAGSAYGHGLGVDQSLPVTIGNRQVAVEASLEPTSIDQISNRSPTLLVRAFDPGSNATISGVVDYRIAVELQGETLLDQRFRSSDGIVLANLVPDESIDGWEIAGRESAAPDEQVPVSQSTPVQLRSRMLTDGGLYHIAVTIESSSTGIQVGQDKRFDLYVSIARSFNFETEGGQEMSVITYYDEVTDFSYENATISFKMPFTWDQAYIDQVPVLHMEVRFPKSIEELQTNSYTGTLNGQNLGAESIQIDDYTSEQDRIVHFVIANTRLSRVAESVGDNSSAAAAAAVFTLKPAEKPKFPLDLVTSPGENYILQLSWGPDVIETGAPVTFVMNIQDPTTGDLIRHSSFDFVLTQAGQEIYKQRLTSDLGTYSHQYAFTQPGTVTLSASNINGESESARIDLVVLQGTGELPVQQQPQQQPPPNQQPSGCLIATAAFGSELTPQVQYLRDFRDNYIMSTASGSAFMNAFNSVYYSFSPQVADYEREQPWLQATVKAGLYPLFGILMASESVYSAVGGEAGAVLAGAIASSLIGAVYLAPAAAAAAAVASRRRVDSKILLIIVGAAAAILTIALVFMPALLPISTSAFVIAAAGSSAIMAAKAVRRAACRLKQLRKL
jgi:hypothetical protein